MWKNKDTFITYLIFILLLGVSFFFTGFGDILKVYDPITMESTNWTPFKAVISSTNKERSKKIELINAYYKYFSETKRSRTTNLDIIKQADRYCELKSLGISKDQVNQLAEYQIRQILAQERLEEMTDKLIIRLSKTYDLADFYICPSNEYNNTEKIKAAELYLKAVRENGIDENVINIEGRISTDSAVLIAGYTACEEISKDGYNTALTNKLNTFSSTKNITTIFTAAHEYLCPETK